MDVIKTVDAVGHILCHDITQIIKDSKKEAIFRKGHVVKEEDIEVLLSLGKDSLYVWEAKEGLIHENDAADILYHICANYNMHKSNIKEGKIDVISDIDGLLKVDIEKLRTINALGEIIIATRHSNFPVKKGDKLASTRVVPLLIEDWKMEKAKAIGNEIPILSLKKFSIKKAGIITTGNEVFHGRIKDTFTPVIIDKLKEYGVNVNEHVIHDDDCEKITSSILSMIKNGAEIILCTGGMSVDPDDKTPLAIKNTGARIVSYGSPVLPGAMFLLAYIGEVPILGLPGCVMYSKKTIFDIMLPRVLAKDEINLEDIASLGHGGLCLSCDTCIFPNCAFGKGF